MASIRSIKRGKGTVHTVLFFVETPNGRKQRSGGSFDNIEDAKLRKLEIEYKEKKGDFIAPDRITVDEFFSQYLPVRGAEKSWSPKYYSDVKKQMKRHILPMIGDKQIQKVTPYDINTLFANLKKKKVDAPRYKNIPTDERPILAASTRQSLYVYTVCLFSAAVEWEVLEKSPVSIQKPKNEVAEEANAWNDETASLALNSIDSSLLRLAVHIGLFTSSRVGEIVGLSISNDINLKQNKISVRKTLQRVDKEALSDMESNEIFTIFPDKADSSTSMVLKATKTKVRKACSISDELAEEIRARLNEIQKFKSLFAENYQDNDLLFCQADGSPVEPALMSKWFRKWNRTTGKELGIPHLKFHELRHTSVSILMDVSNNNAKLVQRITGHTSAKMIFDRYQHADGSKKQLAQKIADKLQAKPNENQSNTKNNELGELFNKFLSEIRSDPQLQKNLINALTET